VVRPGSVEQPWRLALIAAHGRTHQGNFPATTATPGATDTTISIGGTQFVYGGGSATETAINSGGAQFIEGGGATDTTISGGVQSVGGDSGTATAVLWDCSAARSGPAPSRSAQVAPSRWRWLYVVRLHHRQRRYLGTARRRDHERRQFDQSWRHRGDRVRLYPEWLRRQQRRYFGGSLQPELSRGTVMSQLTARIEAGIAGVDAGRSAASPWCPRSVSSLDKRPRDIIGDASHTILCSRGTTSDFISMATSSWPDVSGDEGAPAELANQIGIAPVGEPSPVSNCWTQRGMEKRHVIS
jgi:autotransporter passenger strand-loop-strand repeat protein